MAKLPPTPVGIPPGHAYWNDWYERLRTFVNTTQINHNDTQNIQGGTTTERYHLTAAQQSAIASIPTLVHGTYTPTLTNTTNLDASTAYTCQYLRVGNTVTVSGKVDVDPTTTATLTTLGISLPIASNFATTQQLGGTAATTSNIVEAAAGIFADTVNDRATMQWRTTDVTNHDMFFSFTYLIV